MFSSFRRLLGVGFVFEGASYLFEFCVRLLLFGFGAAAELRIDRTCHGLFIA